MAAALAVRLCKVNSKFAVSAPRKRTSSMCFLNVHVGMVSTTSLRSAKSSMRMVKAVSIRDRKR